MSTPQEIERLGILAAKAQEEYEIAEEAERAAIEVRVAAGNKWHEAREALNNAVQAFVKSKLSSSGERSNG